MQSQTISFEYPPMYEDLADRFRLRGRRDVIFSFGPVIYNPFEVDVGPELLAHELVHGQRQGMEWESIEAWWRSYIECQAFRMREEVAAHRAEYQYLSQHGNRSQRRRALKHVASKLSSPLYGPMCATAEAKAILKR